jgi:hypothetical protein
MNCRNASGQSPNKGMQQSRNKRVGFACKFTHGLLMPAVRPCAGVPVGEKSAT